MEGGVTPGLKEMCEGKGRVHDKRTSEHRSNPGVEG